LDVGKFYDIFRYRIWTCRYIWFLFSICLTPIFIHLVNYYLNWSIFPNGDLSNWVTLTIEIAAVLPIAYFFAMSFYQKEQLETKQLEKLKAKHDLIMLQHRHTMILRTINMIDDFFNYDICIRHILKMENTSNISTFDTPDQSFDKSLELFSERSLLEASNLESKLLWDPIFFKIYDYVKQIIDNMKDQISFRHPDRYFYCGLIKNNKLSIDKEHDWILSVMNKESSSAFNYCNSIQHQSFLNNEIYQLNH